MEARIYHSSNNRDGLVDYWFAGLRFQAHHNQTDGEQRGGGLPWYCQEVMQNPAILDNLGIQLLEASQQERRKDHPNPHDYRTKRYAPFIEWYKQAESEAWNEVLEKVHHRQSLGIQYAQQSFLSGAHADQLVLRKLGKNLDVANEQATEALMKMYFTLAPLLIESDIDPLEMCQ